MELEHDDASGAPSRGTMEERPRDDLMARNRAVFRLLNEWLADESGYDEETWPELKAALQANRSSGRRLFSE